MGKTLFRAVKYSFQCVRSYKMTNNRICFPIYRKTNRELNVTTSSHSPRQTENHDSMDLTVGCQYFDYKDNEKLDLNFYFVYGSNTYFLCSYALCSQ